MELPNRKPPRIKEYDYSTPGAYFITICTKGRKPLLGKIVGGGDFDAPRMLLSEYGTILDKHLNLMHAKYSHMQIDKYVIMPNHFHFILRITESVSGNKESSQ